MTPPKAARQERPFTNHGTRRAAGRKTGGVYPSPIMPGVRHPAPTPRQEIGGNRMAGQSFKSKVCHLSNLCLRIVECRKQSGNHFLAPRFFKPKIEFIRSITWAKCRLSNRDWDARASRNLGRSLHPNLRIAPSCSYNRTGGRRLRTPSPLLSSNLRAHG